MSVTSGPKGSQARRRARRAKFRSQRVVHLSNREIGGHAVDRERDFHDPQSATVKVRLCCLRRVGLPRRALWPRGIAANCRLQTSGFMPAQMIKPLLLQQFSNLPCRFAAFNLPPGLPFFRFSLARKRRSPCFSRSILNRTSPRPRRQSRTRRTGADLQ